MGSQSATLKELREVKNGTLLKAILDMRYARQPVVLYFGRSIPKKEREEVKGAVHSHLTTLCNPVNFHVVFGTPIPNGEPHLFVGLKREGGVKFFQQ